MDQTLTNEFCVDILEVLPIENYSLVLKLLKMEWPLYSHVS